MSLDPLTLLGRLDAFRDAGVLTDIDVHFARFAARLAGGFDAALVLAAVLASHRMSAGHPCVDLAELAGGIVLPGLDEGPVPGDPIRAPSLKQWITALRAAPVVGSPGEDRPLVLDERCRLYLHRYWSYEDHVARSLRERATATNDGVDIWRLREGLARVFRPAGDGTIDWQRVAAATAVLRRLCVVSGGPGTGKTTTVIAILGLWLEQDEHLRIALAAPTGKAAARMQEAIRAARERMPFSPAVRARIPEEASTLHRLLGARHGSSSFRHDRDRPLAIDALIVDEASMIDLALMAKLLDALPTTARLVILGDRDQLASVEAGAVLGDLCGPTPGFSKAFRSEIAAVTGDALPAGAASASPLRDSIVLLTKSHRFDAGSGIGRLAAAVNAGDAGAVRAMVGDASSTGVAWRSDGSRADLVQATADGYGAYLELVAAGASDADVFAAFRRFRVLCAHRRGPWGVEALNQLVEVELRRRLFLDPTDGWHVGRPIMVTQNDRALGLFNGDVGIARPDPDAPEHLRIVFETASGGVRRLTPARLPAHEPVWAMTVHKSQGSEFDRVLLVLPPEDSPLVTRELVYTGSTRARMHVEVWGPEAILLAGIARRSERSSGLRDALWGK